MDAAWEAVVAVVLEEVVALTVAARRGVEQQPQRYPWTPVE